MSRQRPTADYCPHDYEGPQEHEWWLAEGFEHPPDKAVITHLYECRHCEARKEETYERTTTTIQTPGERDE